MGEQGLTECKAEGWTMGFVPPTPSPTFFRFLQVMSEVLFVDSLGFKSVRIQLQVAGWGGRGGGGELHKRTGNLTSTIEMRLSWHYGFWTVKTRWCVVSTGASSSPHLCHSLLIIKPKENYSLCSEQKTTKENFFPKPPQTCDLL